MPAPKKLPTSMAIVSVGYRDYLLPSDKAVKVVEIMQSAFECEHHFGGASGAEYEIGAQAENVGMKIVRANQLRWPREAQPGRRALPAPQKD